MPRTKKVAEPVEETSAQAEVTTVTRARAAKTAQTGTLKTTVVDLNGKSVEDINLPEAVFSAKINQDLMAQAVRVYLVNQHQGTRRAKTRGMVSGSTKKIRRQKGTGSARHGAITAPTFVGGGKALGPVAYTVRLTMPPKMKRLALSSALTQKFQNNDVVVVDDLTPKEPKTRLMAQALKQLTNTDKKTTTKVLCVVAEKNEIVSKALRNLPTVTVDMASNITTYEVLSANKVIFAKQAIESLAKFYAKETK